MNPGPRLPCKFLPPSLSPFGVLEATNICRQANGRWLLEDLSLAIAPGDRLALIGPSGSGKTLLLRSLAMLDPFDSGQVRWHGKAVGEHDIPRFRSRVIYLQQRASLLEGTVEENLREPFSLRVHRDKCFDRDRVVGWLEGLERDASFLEKQQHDLSGGEAQLAALLRAVQLDPDLLLLDEPTAALDAAASRAVERMVEDWLDEDGQGRACVWVSHDAAQTERVATTVRRIQGGRWEEDA